MDFFERIKAEAKRCNTTIEGMLNVTFKGKVSRDVYNGWRRRGLYPRADQAVDIARALNTSVEYLVTGESVNKWNPPPKYTEIIEDLELLNEEDLENVRILTRGLAEKAKYKKKRVDKAI